MLWIVGTLLALFCTVFRQQDVPQWPCDYNMPANLDSRWRWCCWSGRVKILVPPVWDSVWCSSYWGNIPAQLWKSCHPQCRLCRVPKIVVPLLKGNSSVIKSLFPHIRRHYTKTGFLQFHHYRKTDAAHVSVSIAYTFMKKAALVPLSRTLFMQIVATVF